MGITRPDFDKFCRIKERAGDQITSVCVDVANGYTNAFISFIQKLRNKFPDIYDHAAGNAVPG